MTFDVEVLRPLYLEERLPAAEVADRLGVLSPGTVKRDLGHHGIPIRRPGRPRHLAGHEPVS